MRDTVKKFDVIVLNPPYPWNSGGNTTTKDLWSDFIELSINICQENGQMTYVLPPEWRQPEHPIYRLLANKQIEYLSIHDGGDGLKTFGAKNRFDWAVVRNQTRYDKSTIRQENEKVEDIDLNDFPFLPNYLFQKLLKILARNDEPRCEVIYSNYAYHHQKPWMRKECKDDYVHSCISTIYENGSAKYLYTNRKTEHFGTPKIIINIAGDPTLIIDIEGKYGICPNAFGIAVTNMQEAQEIQQAIESAPFTKILKCTKWQPFEIDYRMFRYFRKNFYKDFLK